MPIYKTKLKSKQEIAAATMAFHFEKPEGFAYKAGQFADYTLVNPSETDAEGNTRGFTLASAPYEDDIMLATRMRDTAFKRVLKTMKIGTEITLDAPYGSFTLHNNTQIPAVFLTGGIGVTPARSIVLQPPTTVFHTSFSFSILTASRKTGRFWTLLGKPTRKTQTSLLLAR